MCRRPGINDQWCRCDRLWLPSESLTIDKLGKSIGILQWFGGSHYSIDVGDRTSGVTVGGIGFIWTEFNPTEGIDFEFIVSDDKDRDIGFIYHK